MESKETIKSNKIELIQKAIQQLTESSSVDDRSDEDLYLLAKLLSQLESLKEDVILKPSDSERSTAEPNEVPSCAFGEVEVKSKENTDPSSSTTGVGSEDVVKELKKLGRQNRITHFMLSGLIVLTLAWQLSEYSLLLKLKNGVTHPFKSFGSMVTGVLKRHKELKEVLDGDNQSSTKQKENKLLCMDIPSMLMNGNEE